MDSGWAGNSKELREHLLAVRKDEKEQAKVREYPE